MSSDSESSSVTRYGKLLHNLFESSSPIAHLEKFVVECLTTLLDEVETEDEALRALLSFCLISACRRGSSVVTEIVCCGTLNGENVVNHRLENMARLEAMDDGGNCPIHLACMNGFMDCVRVLVEKAGDDVNRQTGVGQATPLHAAVYGGHLEIVRYLIEEKKASIDLRAKDGSTPLHLACVKNRCEVIQYLICEARCDPFFKAGSPTSPFQIAALVGCYQAVEVVFHCITKVDIVQRERKKLNLIMYMFETLYLTVRTDGVAKSSMEDDTERAKIVRLILKYLPEGTARKLLDLRYNGVFRDDKEGNIELKGETLLHIVARKGRGNCVQALLDAGADISIRNSKGETAVDCAMKHLKDPTNESGMLAVRILIGEWEKLRVTADQSMHRLVKEVSTSEPDGDLHEDVSMMAMTNNNNNNNNNNKKVSKRRKNKKKNKKKKRGKSTKPSSSTTAASTETLQKCNDEDEEDDDDDEDDEEEDEEDDDGEKNEDVDEAKTLERHKHSLPAPPPTSDDSSNEWIKAHGGKVKFPQSETEENVSNEHQKHLQQLLAKTLLDSLQGNKDIKEQRKEGIEEVEESVDVEQEDSIGDTEQQAANDAKPDEFGSNIEDDENLISLMKQVAWQGSWEPAWQKQDSNGAFHHDNASFFPQMVETSNPVHGANDNLLINNVAAKDPIHQFLPNGLLDGDGTAAGQDLETLFQDLEPTCCQLGLKLENLLGVGLSNLSLSQLDSLRDLHRRQLDKILEAQLQSAREQGRILAEETTNRRFDFATFSSNYFA